MKKWESLLGRRDFIKAVSYSGLTFLASGCASHLLSSHSFQENADKSPLQSSLVDEDFLTHYGPIDRTLAGDSRKSYYGDQNQRPHHILWNRDEYLKSKTVEGPVEFTDVVIVGGGISGLSTAYHLKKYRPIVLEQAARFGGNAKGQSWNGIDYGLGSAYIDLPRPGTPMGEFYEELKLGEVLTQRSHADPIEYKGKLYTDFWMGESDSKQKHKYLKLANFFQNLSRSGSGGSNDLDSFPLIPSLKNSQLSRVYEFDQWNLYELIVKVLDGKIPEQLDRAIEHYSWSTYAASAKEVSAAAALNFLAQESGTICVGAGGNAKITERVLSELIKTVPSSHFRTHSIVLKVNRDSDGCEVLYEDSVGKLRKIRSKAVVLACPKFVVAKILDQVEPERLSAIKKLRYRSYMTANVLVKKRMKRQYYDVFKVGEGKARYPDLLSEQAHVNATDFVLSNFATPNANGNVLTFFRAFPYDGARRDLYRPDSYEHFRSRFEYQLEKEIFPLLSLNGNDVEDIRIALWGHALPLAAQGIYQDGTVEQLRKPFREKIFFIEQDNWAYPSLQTGITEAAFFQSEIKKAIESV